MLTNHVYRRPGQPPHITFASPGNIAQSRKLKALNHTCSVHTSRATQTLLQSISVTEHRTVSPTKKQHNRGVRGPEQDTTFHALLVTHFPSGCYPKATDRLVAYVKCQPRQSKVLGVCTTVSARPYGAIDLPLSADHFICVTARTVFAVCRDSCRIAGVCAADTYACVFDRSPMR